LYYLLKANVNKPSAIHPHRILECLTNRRFGVEYQPLVCTKTGETQCHEALARFIDSAGRQLPPDLVFEALHENPLLLLHAELEMKRLQMAEAPQHGLLFVNLDPDSYAVGMAEDGKNVFLPVLLPQRSRLVVEVIENLHLQDILRAESMMQALGQEKVRMAIDDLSSSRGLVSYSALAQASFLKFDRSWLSGNLSTKQRTILTWAIAQAIDLGLTTVLEGIESQQQLDMAKDMGFDLAQGFIYKERFIQRGCAIKRQISPRIIKSPAAC
jgi:EAL domain-containing protein (putative c-di-GMP-specific phosphodiesterase class I)